MANYVTKNAPKITGDKILIGESLKIKEDTILKDKIQSLELDFAHNPKDYLVAKKLRDLYSQNNDFSNEEKYKEIFLKLIDKK
jgi:hypothetical protein